MFYFEQTPLEGVIVVTPKVYEDKRGYFFESYQQEEFFKNGIDCHFVQDNQSRSSKNVLRGLHFQKKYPQSKLIRVLAGEILDVVVDLRKKSPTFGKYFSIKLSSDNKKQLFVPKGFAHGFLVLSETAEIAYKCDDFYHPEDEGVLLYNDQKLGIEWPGDKDSYILSEKDLKGLFLEEIDGY